MGLSETKIEILEAVAEAEHENQPFEYSHEGITYEEIRSDFIDEFDVDPTLKLPALLKSIYDGGFLEKTYTASNSPNQYRLTSQGWNAVSTQEPYGGN